MLGHISLPIVEREASARFYDAVLATLGWVRLWTGDDGLGYGPPGNGEKLNLFVRESVVAGAAGYHFAFNAADRDSVDAFHAAALANGGADNGAPGPRPHYGSSYYAAFVVDPDGHRLEAVHQ